MGGLARAFFILPFSQARMLTIYTGHDVAQTPSSNRQRLNGEPNVGIAVSNLQIPRSLGTPMQPRISPARGLFGGVRSNGSGGNGFAGYGMSAGLKVSHTPPSGAEGLRSVSRTGPMPRGITLNISLPITYLISSHSCPKASLSYFYGWPLISVWRDGSWTQQPRRVLLTRRYRYHITPCYTPMLYTH